MAAGMDAAAITTLVQTIMAGLPKPAISATRQAIKLNLSDFDGKPADFEDWSLELRSYMHLQGFQDFNALTTEGNTTLFYLLMHLCKGNAKQPIKSVTEGDGKAAYDALQTRYNNARPGRIMELWMLYFTTIWDFTSTPTIDDHVSTHSDLRRQLTTLKEPPTTTLAIVTLLRSLPDAVSSAATTLKLTPGVTIEAVEIFVLEYIHDFLYSGN
jgi:hypothetical protein